MNIKDYRRKIEQQIARSREASAETSWNPAMESAGALETLGSASDGDDTQRLRGALADRSAPANLRAAALGELARQNTDRRTSHAEALDRLADADEHASVRLAALQILKVAAFHSPTGSDWRPDYLDALRSASAADDEALRLAAFSALTAMKDRSAQEALLEGLNDPSQARVAAHHALRLLGRDPHSGVQDAARALADARDDETVHLEALRVLSSDAGSVDRFRSLVVDRGESPAVRKLAATALNSLAPDTLREAVEAIEAAEAADLLNESSAGPSVSDTHARLHIASLLD